MKFTTKQYERIFQGRTQHQDIVTMGQILSERLDANEIAALHVMLDGGANYVLVNEVRVIRDKQKPVDCEVLR